MSSSQNRWLLLKDLRRIVQARFGDRIVTLEPFEDGSGVHFITVDNGDATFELFDFQSTPTALELVGQVLGLELEDIEVNWNEYLVREEDRREFLGRLMEEFAINPELHPGDWKDAGHGTEPFRRWEKWLEGYCPVRLIESVSADGIRRLSTD